MSTVFVFREEMSTNDTDVFSCIFGVISGYGL